MSDAAPPPETPEIVEPEQATVSDPAKLIRLGTMVQTLMAEVRQADTDEASRYSVMVDKPPPTGTTAPVT